MNSLFTVKEDLIEIKVPYLELKNGVIFFKEPEESGKFSDRLKTALAYFERPKWSNFSEYIKDCIFFDEKDQENKIDLIKLRHKKLAVLLKKLINGDGKEEKLTKEYIDNILPDFGIILVQKFDEKIEKEQEGALEQLQSIIEEIKKEEDKNSDEPKVESKTEKE